MSVLSICLVCNFSIVATCPSIQLPALLFVYVLFLLFVDVLSGEPRQNLGRGLVDHKLVQAPPPPPPPPVFFIAGRPKAALLFWFFGDFRCGALLFMVIQVIYINIKIGKNSC